ncbi:TusE/DsrC/DsvC family sulfur relay protein [Microbulbifer sp. OS29]|uniref:Sulfurtransferase n=1 Tax=Microbulbifer okhotskensis TaxID=2926617 RepID=A0A9X2ER62_9GAMM|nr:TusE/DsrC/DsvC family sulfur relay protein [Microbulbifer okhotskensis]MCO1335885.1 TusE/DsrC/DsvC family sulfur relay protein [Microbulbifer okhotskensis]
MSNLIVNGREIPLDKEGYLRNLNDWSRDTALQLASAEDIELTDEHWQIIELLQGFYREFELSPAMRPLVKYIAQHLGAEKGRSIYLMQLFPPSPAKVASKIAGLPKPTHCL